MTDKSAERIDLEERAKAAGVKFAGNIGDESLKERVEAAEAAANTAPGTSDQENPVGSTEQVVSDEGPVLAEVQTAPATEIPHVLVISGPARGFRRAGRRFGPQQVTIPVKDLSDDAYTALLSEPALTVVELGKPQGD
ncbi:hypothetical protein [Oceanicola sp. S124]|uniref:hypothetical protein n=1 Tax=Oceanicola sp. S124 TaxID=1042378 RepID=UPI0002558661|nr:hypothetical protein [Oceanicola sp. S124]